MTATYPSTTANYIFDFHSFDTSPAQPSYILSSTFSTINEKYFDCTISNDYHTAKVLLTIEEIEKYRQQGFLSNSSAKSDMKSVCIHTNDKKYELVESLSSLDSPITHATKFNSKALNNAIWSEEKIYWRMDSTYPYIDTKTIEKMIRFAFSEASIQTPLIINQKRRSTSDAQIILNWLGKKDEPYFKSESYLAFGYGPAQGLGGNITMNADVFWRLDKTKLTVKQAYDLGMIADYDRNYPDNTVRTYDPLHTIKHEGGHALGMKHIELESEKLTSIMYPFYNGLRKFGDADLTYLIDLYGKSTLSHEIKEYLRNKILNFR